MASSSLCSGGYAYNYYHGDKYWHERLLIGHLEGDFWYICTPDGDMYDEQISSDNPDLVAMRAGAGAGGRQRPTGLGPLVHVFKYMIDSKRARLFAEGTPHLKAERKRRGLPAEIDDPPEKSKAILPAAEGSWVLAEAAGSLKIGDAIDPSTSLVRIGDAGLDIIDDKVRQIRWLAGGKKIHDDFIKSRTAEIRAQLSACDAAAVESGWQQAVNMADEDVRTLSVKFGVDGSRRRTFRESLEEMEEAPFDDWPLEGPRTCQWVVREISRLAEGPRAQHSLWLRGSKIPDGDRAGYEDAVLAQILETAVTYDALSVVNLACMELLVRRRQLLAEAHVGNPSAPSYEGGEYFLGAGRTAAGAVIAPALTNHVAEKMRADASIQKERRKLAETRTLPSPKKPAKGAGRGGGGGPE